MSIDDLLYKDLKNEKQTPTDRRAIRIKVLGSVPAGIPIEAIEDVTGYEDIPIGCAFESRMAHQKH